MNTPIPASESQQLSANQLSPLLKAAADPLRLEILRLLRTDSFGVLELCHLFQVKQSSMSHHLKVMACAGLVTTRREGNSIFYRRNFPSCESAASQLQMALYQTTDQLQIDESLHSRVDDIHHQRAEASRIFFTEHADQFQEKQDLIAGYSVYAGQVADMLAASPLTKRKRALEVGPGEGLFLEVLAKTFLHVTALDNSESLLATAKQFCQTQQLGNIDFIHNDTRYCRTTSEPFDCVVINMVLHHASSPAQIFTDVGLAMKSNGVLLVCELCNHDQDWARQACGDIWLGFDPQDLGRWANDANFTEGQSIYFALRNGFQIQLRQFIKE
ncbi:metalloregulator ArsR/SmtB family transcription factor [Teredinibacter franksiae]|uniref:metalloregulator ArsR/SmtB family transcription factor n=1 Tax=Teredinibacter franksiae TaxID=2761453 RepID=UPI001624C693|nr:metalloregulator ArsR/SmtB family transcription factor [Teredinibacter franksiae]